jgi:hypothetical protein
VGVVALVPKTAAQVRPFLDAARPFDGDSRRCDQVEALADTSRLVP